MDWFDEKVESVKKANWIYKMMCFLTFRKRLSYKELYMILVKINEKKLGTEKAKALSMNKIVEFYKDLHDGQLPDGVY